MAYDGARQRDSDTAYLTSGQAARRAGISTTTLRRAVQRGDLAPAWQTAGGYLRFLHSDVDAYAARRSAVRQPATPSPRPVLHAVDQQAGDAALDKRHKPLDLAAPERILRTLFDVAAWGVVVWNAAAEVVQASETAQRIIGIDPRTMRGRAVTDRPYLFTRLDGTPLPLEERPSMVALRTGQPQTKVLIGVVRPDGQQRFLQVDAVPVKDDDGAVALVIMSFVDVTERHRAEEELRRSYEYLHSVIANAPVNLYVLDRNGIFTWAEGKGAQALGISPQDLVGRSIFDLYRDLPEVQERVRRALAGEAFTALIDVGGLTLETHYSPLHDAQGHNVGTVAVLVDVTERARAEAALRESEARNRAILNAALDAIVTVDHQGRIAEFNPAAERLFGYSRAEAVGQEIVRLIVPPAAQERHREGMQEYLTTGQSHVVGKRIEGRAMRRDGTIFPVELATTRIPDMEPPLFVGYIRDITERKRAEEALRHQALHDALTGLPNRTLLHDRLEHALLVAQRERTSLALLLLDLDHFKEVNDTFGHHLGDLLLQKVADRLRTTLRAADTVARLGGDEFAVLLAGESCASAALTASKVGAALDVPFQINGQTIHVGVSIGIALSPEHGLDPATLLRHADVAMYAAKRTRTAHVVYAAEMDRHTPDRLALAGDLRQAVARGELALHYQPKVELSNNRPNSVEALVRWYHPQRGFVPPDQFIPLAEQVGLITPLTHWVLESALSQCRAWRRAGLDLAVAVNLSMVDLHDPQLPDVVAGLLHAHEVAPSYLRLEVTESAIMADMTRTQDVLARLAALGIGISVDDYGTGYSSLAYLRRLPVDELKIDMSFVRHMAEDETDAAIVASTVSLGHTLGLRVVAEGVENGEAWERLRSLGCDAAQGYYLSRPLPASELETWLHKSNQRSAIGD